MPGVFWVHCCHFSRWEIYIIEIVMSHQNPIQHRLSGWDLDQIKYQSKNLKICSVTVFKRSSKFIAVNHCSIIGTQFLFFQLVQQILFDSKRWKRLKNGSKMARKWLENIWKRPSPSSVWKMSGNGYEMSKKPSKTSKNFLKSLFPHVLEN